MADISSFTIITFQRQPGSWRASISRKDNAVITTEGKVTLRSIVTPMDSASEEEARKAALDAIKRL